MSGVSSPLKWHGGKSYLAKRIVSLMPQHLTYCEPFAGGLSVLLEKNPDGVSEVANDLNQGLTAFWNVLSSETLFPQFVRWAQATPFSESTWQESKSYVGYSAPGSYTVATALHFFINCRQSLAGRMDSFAPLTRSRTRRGMNEQVSAWLSAVEGLPEVHARLKRVAITNRPAVKVIQDLDHPETLFYCDPPYLKETRTAKEVYQHEMNADDHVELLDCLSGIKGQFILSGYPHWTYTSYEQAKRWHRIDIEIDNKSAGGSVKRKMTECLWMNFKLKGA